MISENYVIKGLTDVTLSALKDREQINIEEVFIGLRASKTLLELKKKGANGKNQDTYFDKIELETSEFEKMELGSQYTLSAIALVGSGDVEDIRSIKISRVRISDGTKTDNDGEYVSIENVPVTVYGEVTIDKVSKR